MGGGCVGDCRNISEGDNPKVFFGRSKGPSFSPASAKKNILNDVRFECPQQVVTHRRVVSVGRYKFATVAVRPNLSIDQTIIILILWATGPLLPSTVSALFTAPVVASRDPLDDSPRLSFVGHSAVIFWD